MATTVDALLTKARSAERRGDLAGAQRAYVGVLERYPGNLRARTALAALDQALAPTYQALAPPYAELAPLVALCEAGRHDEALARANHLLQHYPQCHFLHNIAGVALAALGERETALAALHAALDIKPDYADAHFNLATTYEAAGQYEDALGFYLRAVALRPDHAPSLTRLGQLYAQRHATADAISMLERACACDPQDFDTLRVLAGQLRLNGELTKAIAAYERALALSPAREDIRVLLAATRAAAGDWSAPDPASPLTALGLCGQVVSNLAMAEIDPDPAHALIRARTTAQAIACDAGPVTPLALPAAAADGRIRVGYFSSDFHDHATMYLMSGFFREHDRTRFAVHLYSYGARRSDAQREALTAQCEGFHDVLGMPDEAVVALARGHGLDLAVDLKGYTMDARTGLFARRMAPVQVQWVGYPGTMGADFIDYIVADAVVVPPEERAHYSEAVICLPGSYQPNDNRRAIAPTAPTRAACGLPPSGTVLCCFNRVWKIGPEEFDIWMALLRAVPGAVLWLFESNALAGANLRREAAARGVAPERLVLAPILPHAEHLARLRHADLFLDTFTCNAHTTASDALWAGVPVLTCAGRAFPARVAASLITAAGLPELVTTTPDNYARLARELASDPPRLAALRARLAAQRETCALFATQAHTRAVEAAWTAIVERSRAGLAPADIQI